MILVAFKHGLRASEVVSIVADDVRDGYLKVRRKKHSLPTTQPLLDHPDPLLAERPAVLESIKKLRPKDRLFPVTRQHFWLLVKTYARAAGVPEHRAKPHALKASCAMQMIDSAGIHHTQKWLGHRSMASTGRYLEPTNQDVEQAARRALGEK